jgi:hypothetical protein
LAQVASERPQAVGGRVVGGTSAHQLQFKVQHCYLLLLNNFKNFFGALPRIHSFLLLYFKRQIFAMILACLCDYMAIGQIAIVPTVHHQIQRGIGFRINQRCRPGRFLSGSDFLNWRGPDPNPDPSPYKYCIKYFQPEFFCPTIKF